MTVRRWSREAVQREIRSIAGKGGSLSYGKIARERSALLSAGIRYFGSWRAAVESAGFRYSQICAQASQARAQALSRWDEGKVLKEIKRLWAQGEDLSYGNIKKKHLQLLSAACSRHRFGSWKRAISAAGLDYDKVVAAGRERKRRLGRTWYKLLIAEQVGRVTRGRRLKEATARGRFPQLLKVAETYFGQWERALTASKKSH